MKTAAAFIAGFTITAAVLFGSGAKPNDAGEAIVMFLFCMFWPLTWAYVAIATVVLLCLGWRGGPIW